MGTASGKFVLRISEILHREARERALEDDMSLNEVCGRALEHYLHPAPDSKHGSRESSWVGTIRDLIGDPLIGVVLFGSTARGENGPQSDLDLLIALDGNTSLSRQLYTRWDLEFLDVSKSPHFVHIPPGVDAAGSIWIETAIDGIVLYEKQRQVSRFLIKLRHAIADGVFVRRLAHGHAYWIKNDVESANA